MTLLEHLLGRGRALRPHLQTLSTVAGAVPALRSMFGLVPTGCGSVCYRLAGDPAEQSAADGVAVPAGDPVQRTLLTRDASGCTTLRCWHPPGDVAGLIADLVEVNDRLAQAGFGRSLRYTALDFTEPGRRARALVLVQLMPRGTFYVFVPTGPRARDRTQELRVRGVLASTLPIEPDLARWLPV